MKTRFAFALALFLLPACSTPAPVEGESAAESVASSSHKACGGFVGGTCAHNEYCDVTVANACGGADLPGVCKPVAHWCTEIYQPECGCDGKTYANDCQRVQAKVQLDHAGKCAPVAQACGGVDGGACPTGQYCDTNADSDVCGAGVCKTAPKFCVEIYKPVCGCDGQTYGNDCDRQAAGAQLAYQGECN